MRNYLENRERAMAWLNGDQRDFNQGIAILEDAQFKPGVVGVLKRHGSGRCQSDERLVYHMRDFVRCFAVESAAEDTDLLIDVVDGKEMSTTKIPADEKLPSMLSNKVTEMLEGARFPEDISAIVRDYRSAYVEREQLMNKMAELPEDNDEVTVGKRKAISDRLKELSDLMDELYPKYEQYMREGKLPAKEAEPEAQQPAGLDTMGKEELQKLRKLTATKISRARNMLLYQTEAKQEQENPMTDERKIAKYNAKIARLAAELNDIEMAIARLG